jgi:DNA-binding SARP family transcriptional activator/ABC-type branched-subunit amino acid transport system substrate-binding protein/sugar lactone lactonase YvrE
VRLGGTKQKALLAVLLLDAGQVVSSDRLIDELWGESPPADAQTALQAHVSRLRKLLEPDHSGEPAVLVTRAPGYALLVGDDQLDLRRFEALVTEARALLAEGDAERAAERVRRGLDLWRGRPLADLEDEPVADEATRELDEAWLGALETRVEADLAVGRHAQLVPELTTLVRRHPLQEALRAQLMLALYRSGRQAEALDAYDAGRRVLAEELGLEPGSRLRELQAGILAQDPELDYRPAPARAPPPSRKRQIPWWAPAVGLAAVAAAAAAGAVMLLSDDDAGTPADGGGSLVRVDPRSAEVERRVSVGATPGAVSAGEGAVWAVDLDGQTVSRVDPESGETIAFGTGATPTDLVAGAGAVWVANGSAVRGAQSTGPVATALARVDPSTRTVRARIRLPRSGGAATELTEDHVAVERDAVWAIAPDFSVLRVDPRTNRIVATIRGLQARAIAAGDAGVWVLGMDGTIARVNRATNRIDARDLIRASAVASLTVGGGAAWVSAPGDGTVWRVQPGPRLVMRTIDVGTGVGDLSFGAGWLWAVNPLRGTLTRIDPHANRVSRHVRLGGAPRAVDAGARGVWVAVAGDARREPAAAGAGAPVHAGCEPTLYRGRGAPERLIVTDLPLQGGVRLSAQQMAQAAAFVLDRRGFRAGDLHIGIQSCDDSVARTGLFDPGKCAANARAYASDRRVVGVVGTLNSPCSLAALPELARAPGGPLAMVSPVNSYVGLTRPAAGAPAGELESLYPGGGRHFARVYPTDDHQAVALAELAAELSAERVAVLDDGDLLYGHSLADRFVRAARARGIEVVARHTWDPTAASFGGLAIRVARAEPDAVYLGGVLDANGAGVLRALRRELGARAQMLLSDGFTPTSVLVRQAGRAADGAYLSVSGLINESFGARGRRFARAFGATLPGVTIEPSAVYTAEATGVLLDAIARSDGTRAGVLDELFRTSLRRGLTGSVRFDERGDVVAPPITILRIARGTRGVPNFPGATLARVVRSRLCPGC